MTTKRTAVLVEAALSIALAAVLGQVKLLHMPQGGDVSLEMLPLIVFAMRRGVGPGVAAGMLYGILNLLLVPAPNVHWAQIALDYPVAHGLVGLTGLFAGAWRKTFARSARAAVLTALLPAVAVGSMGRFLAHWVSGIIFFGMYAPKGQPVWLYSLVYNGTYMLPDAAICFVAAAAILPVLERRIPAR